MAPGTPTAAPEVHPRRPDRRPGRYRVLDGTSSWLYRSGDASVDSLGTFEGERVVSDENVVVLAVSDLLPTQSRVTPLYAQLAPGLERAITSDALPAGSRLENGGLAQRAARALSCRSAGQELVNKDLLVRRRGIGTQVVHGAVARQIELTSLYDDIKRSGGVPSTRVLDSTRVPVSAAAAEHLGVTRNTEVLRLRRLRLARGVPSQCLRTTCPRGSRISPRARWSTPGSTASSGRGA